MRTILLVDQPKVSALERRFCAVMTTDSAQIGGTGEFGAGSGFTDVIDNAINSAQKAFSEYNAHATTPPPANTIEAIGKNITTPALVIVGALFLIWALH